ncbi:MAG TPA: hypothetical protein VL463_08355 [Kofleriaceae bacterium]|jgi:eight-cysteine-cluster-containing protein|nr:hypothetical protein [Kofleriaceae bacterium]
MRTASIVIVLFVAACSGSSKPGTAPPPSPSAQRTPAIAPDDPMYARLEGTDYDNACTTDADCHTGGCSGEVCSHEEGVITSCEMRQGGFPTQGASCGCVESACIWYRAP